MEVSLFQQVDGVDPLKCIADYLIPDWEKLDTFLRKSEMLPK